MQSKLAKQYNAQYCTGTTGKNIPPRIPNDNNMGTREFLSMPQKHQENFAQGKECFVEYC